MNRHLMEIDPDLPGFIGIWRGERGPVWQVFLWYGTTTLLVLGGVGFGALCA